MIPLVETAASTPFAPNGLKPSAAVKLLAWKLTMPSTKIVSSGIADLPPGRRAVRVGELADAEEVDRGEDRHQDHRRDDALAVSTLVPLLVFIQPLANE